MDVTISRNDRALNPDASAEPPVKNRRKRNPRDADWYPEHVYRRYLVVDTNLYRDGVGKDLAMRDYGDRLEATKPAGRDTIADMVAIAAHRGWHRIAVEGDREGRREAWLAARLNGLEVTGYDPTKVDLAALEKAGGVGARLPAPSTPTQAPGRVDGVPERETLTLNRTAAAVVPLRAADDGLAPQPQTQPPAFRQSFAPTTSDISELLAAQTSKPWQPNAALQVAFDPPPTRDPVPSHDPLKSVKDAVKPSPVVAAVAEPTREGERRAQLFTMAETNGPNREQAIRDPAVRAAIAHMIVIEKVVKSTVANAEEQRRVINGAWQRMADFLSKGGVPHEPKIEALNREAGRARSAVKAEEPVERERTHERARGR